MSNVINFKFAAVKHMSMEQQVEKFFDNLSSDNFCEELHNILVAHLGYTAEDLLEIAALAMERANELLAEEV